MGGGDGLSEHARTHLVDALKRLEYRGYDSAGVATLENGGTLTRRRAVARLSVRGRAAARTREPANAASRARRPGPTKGVESVDAKSPCMSDVPVGPTSTCGGGDPGAGPACAAADTTATAIDVATATTRVRRGSAL